MIVHATPARAPTLSNRHASSNGRRGGGEDPPGQRRTTPYQKQQQKQQQQGSAGKGRLEKPAQVAGAGSNRLAPAAAPSTLQHQHQPQHQQARRGEPKGERGSSSHRASADTAEGGSRRTQQQPRPQPQTASKASTALRGGVSARGSGGSSGLATSPSATNKTVLEANDTGDKVTCPVCHRGMDHWKSGQRQQVMCCLGRQASSNFRFFRWSWFCHGLLREMRR